MTPGGCQPDGIEYTHGGRNHVKVITSWMSHALNRRNQYRIPHGKRGVHFPGSLAAQAALLKPNWRWDCWNRPFEPKAPRHICDRNCRKLLRSLPPSGSPYFSEAPIGID